ncbi:unnamed protein product [Musa acuminata subsp. burmannicoides]
MWKQFLSKLPHKSFQSDASLDLTHLPPGNDGTGSVNGNSIHRTSSDNVVSSRSTTMKWTASAIFPSSVVTSAEPLLLFKDVPNAEKQNLFISKLNFCCLVFDFSDPNKNSAEKDMKRQVLLDLIGYVDAGTSRFTEPVISASCKMIAINLFRAFPPNTRSGNGGGEAEEEVPVYDSAWTHLQLVYDLLQKFIESSYLDSKIGKKYIDHSFVMRLLDLFDSEDPRERDCLKTILHRIYGKFMVHRPFIRKAVSNIFYRFVFETDRHNGIVEILEVFGSVISGFAQPLKEEHKLLLWRVLMPLHKPKTLGVYQQQLTYCVTQFIEKEPKLASSVIKGLLRYWPVTSSQKEVMFLSELEEILEATNTAELQGCMIPLFRRIGFCINSSHFQVAERALFLWNNNHVINLMAQNRQAIMPLVLPALERNLQSHWNQTVLNLTQYVKKMFSEMDEELVLACKKKFEEKEKKQKTMEEKRRLIWEHMETSAAFHPVTRNTTVLVVPVIAPPIAAALT